MFSKVDVGGFLLCRGSSWPAPGKWMVPSAKSNRVLKALEEREEEEEEEDEEEDPKSRHNIFSAA